MARFSQKEKVHRVRDVDVEVSKQTTAVIAVSHIFDLESLS